MDLSTAVLDGIVNPQLANCPATLPEKWICQDNYLWGPGVDYTGVEFGGKEFVVDAPGAFFWLENAKLNGAKQVTFRVDGAGGFEAAGIQGANSTSLSFYAQLITTGSDFSSADFGADQWTLRSYGAEDASDILVPLTLSGGDFSQMTQMHLVTGQGGNWSGSDSGAGTTFSESEFLVFRTGVDAKVGKAHTNLADVNFPPACFGRLQFTWSCVRRQFYWSYTQQHERGGIRGDGCHQCPLYECRSVGVDFVPAVPTGASLVEQTSQESPGNL